LTDSLEIVRDWLESPKSDREACPLGTLFARTPLKTLSSLSSRAYERAKREHEPEDRAFYLNVGRLADLVITGRTIVLPQGT
jgi:hypothetical protein